jgi:catechol 2,3-dioxygenase-like lactoylglutathione lyase family enzyme
MPLDTACIDHVQIAVPKGLEAECLAFYRQLFGFPELPKPRELQGRGVAWFRIGGLQLHAGIDPEPSAQSRRHIGFLVADLATARREVPAQRIRIDEASVADSVSRFFFREPAGNRIEIGQRG